MVKEGSSDYKKVSKKDMVLQRTFEWFFVEAKIVILWQWYSNLAREIHFLQSLAPALIKLTYQWFSNDPKTLISMLRCVWLGLELNSAGNGSREPDLSITVLWHHLKNLLSTFIFKNVHVGAVSSYHSVNKNGSFYFETIVVYCDHLCTYNSSEFSICMFFIVHTY